MSFVIERDNITYGQLLADASDALRDSGVPDYQYDAFALFEYVFNISKAQYLMKRDDKISDQEQINQYVEAVNRRSVHEPLQYITGVQNFYGLDFYVDSRVLIPRLDTEIVVESILKREKETDISVLDMCAGSGCIGITLANKNPGWKVTGSDISEDALSVCAINKGNLGASNISFVHSNLFEQIDGKYDVIVSNPPYIESQVVKGLMSEVKDFEPGLALDGGADGLDFYRAIVSEARAHLNNGGRLYFEIGYNQGQALRELFEEYGYTDILIRQDLAGLDRMACASLSV